MKYSIRKNIKTRNNSIKKLRKNKTRKLNGGVKTSSILLFPLALSSSFIMPNNKPSGFSRISRQIQQPLNIADGGGGVIPPSNFLTKISFQEDPPNENGHKAITDEELLQKIGVKKSNLEKLLKAEREGAKNKNKIQKMQRMLNEIKKKYPHLFL